MNSAMSLAGTGCLLLCITACIPLPIPHTERVTPSVRADFRARSGHPAAGVADALTASRKDTLCERAVIQRVTDARGHIEVPPVEKRESIFWLTMMDRTDGIGYWVCTGTIDSLGAPVYESRTEISGRMAGDDLDCFSWEAAQRPFVSCYSERMERPLRGGRWQQGSSGGIYRVLFVHRPHCGDARPFVQWLVGDSIVAVSELPREAEPCERKRLGLSERGGRWYLTYAEPHSTFWIKLGKHWVTYELGAPGEVREVPS